MDLDLLGRAAERREIEILLGGARNGRGGALLFVGEPGIGKSALLGAVNEVSGMRVLRVSGYESEAHMPYAAVHRLALPLRGYADALPPVQRQALRVAAGTTEGPPPDRHLVGLGALALFSAAGSDHPLVCLIDDAHWLDPESLDVLMFTARRLYAEPIALVFAAREEPGDEVAMAGIRTIRLAGLATDEGVELLRRCLDDPLDPALAAQITLATHGNPLALIDLAGELSAERLTDVAFAAEPVPVGRRLEAHYVRRTRHLTVDAQLWLLIAAADSTGNLKLIGEASHRLGLPDSAVDEAEKDGMVDLGATVLFRHPLVRSAVYGAAPGGERRRVHAALAAGAERLGLVELGAWHAAKATVGPDEEVAARLEAVAERAGARGGQLSRTRGLREAARLTPASQPRSVRLVHAAEAALASGAALLAKSVLDDVDDQVLDADSRATTIATRASVAIFIEDPALRRACADMLSAAELLHGSDAAKEQDALVQAFYYLLPAERLAEGVTLDELGRRMAAGVVLADRPAATILEALSALILRPYEEAVEPLRKAVAMIRDTRNPEILLRYGPISVVLTTALWDVAARRDCLDRTVTAARDLGWIRLLDTALWGASMAELRGGSPRRAAQHIDQINELRRGLGYGADPVANPAMLAWTDAPRPAVQRLADRASRAGLGAVDAAATAALAASEIAGGRYADAFTLLQPLDSAPFLHVTPLEYADLVEAGARSGRAADVVPVLRRLEHMAHASGSDWAQGVAARSRGLVDRDQAEAHFRSAVDLLDQGHVEVDLGRAHLLLGECLRRARRRGEAQTELRRAVEILEAADAPLFAERARRELRAAGASDTLPPYGSSDYGLTTQEATVARLAARGNTNAEIAATMFLSANTVDYHLRKVFSKVGISSRRQLAERLGDDA